MNTPVPLAARMAEIEPFHVMDLLARAKALEAEGRSIIHMEVGEPDFVTAEPIVQAGCQALLQGHTHYTPAVGLPALREALSGYYAQHFGIAVDPARLVITPGASGALQLVLGVLVNPGDQVLMADPGYPCNRHFVRLFEGRARGVPVDAGSAYQLTADLVDRYWTPRTVAVLVASPSNPTGTLVSAAEMAAIREVVRAKGGRLIIDEIYQGLVYRAEPYSALALADDIFVINSFSKYFGMTGWRVGWLAAPPDYVPAIDRLAQNIFLAASTPAQHGALAALRPETLEVLDRRRETYRQRRDYLLPALRGLGLRIPVTPQGAFYLYADCSALTDDSFGFAHTVLDQVGVCITPGKDFGFHQPERHLRFAYTTSLENLQEGVRRLQEFLGVAK